MARPHIEFIHTQQLPWAAGVLPARPRVAAKMLSADSETGACSVLLRYPPGWTQDGAVHLTAGEEFYVLGGALTVNGRAYGLDCFAYLPAGYVRTSAASPGGCDVIAFFDAAPHCVAGVPAGGGYDTSAAVPYLNAHDMIWESEGMDPYYSDWGMKWKILNHDPVTNATAMLVAVPPQMHPENWQGPQEIHDCKEEAFVLAGDLHTHNGVFYNGMYFYRPPRIYHGPFATRFGSLMLVRVDGVLENNWTKEETKLRLYPDHKPYLPDDLRAVAGTAWQPEARY